MSSHQMITNTSLNIATPINDNTLTNLLVIDGTNNIKYRTVATLPSSNPFNQSLNTTDYPSFIGINGGPVIPPGQISTGTGYITTGSMLQMFGKIDTYYIVVQTTSSASFNVFRYTTANNTSYLFLATVSSSSTTGSPISIAHIQSRRLSVYNNPSANTTSTSSLETLSGSNGQNAGNVSNAFNIKFDTSGLNVNGVNDIVLSISSLTGQPTNWTIVLQVIPSP